MLSDTITRAPLFSRISLTCDPPFPMMMDASWVTIRQRMWMLAEGAEACAPAEDKGSPDVVTEEPFPPREEFLLSSDFPPLVWPLLEPGVDPVLSSAPTAASVIVTSTQGMWGLAPGSSFETGAMPVLARLCCFGGSLSDGERDLLRLVSGSGIANLVYCTVTLKRIGGGPGWGLDVWVCVMSDRDI